MEGWGGDWDERKEGRKDGEVRDDIDTRMERRGGLDGGEERRAARHVISGACDGERERDSRPENI